MQVEQQKGRLAPSVLVKPISFCVDNLVMIGESRGNTVLRASSGRVSCIHTVWQQRSCHARHVLVAVREPALLKAAHSMPAVCAAGNGALVYGLCPCD